MSNDASNDAFNGIVDDALGDNFRIESNRFPNCTSKDESSGKYRNAFPNVPSDITTDATNVEPRNMTNSVPIYVSKNTSNN